MRPGISCSVTQLSELFSLLQGGPVDLAKLEQAPGVSCRFACWLLSAALMYKQERS